jgi:hypothetical protein
MSKSSELLIGAVVIVVLLGFLISSWDRHMRWEVRLFRWRMRIFFHCVAFVAIIAIAAYGYSQIQHKNSSKNTPALSTHKAPTNKTAASAPALAAPKTPTGKASPTTPKAPSARTHKIKVKDIAIDRSRKNTYLVFTRARGQHFDVSTATRHLLHVGRTYRCQVRGYELSNCVR